VLVHGTAVDHRSGAPVVPAFEQRFRVCAVDRLGRGGSGDIPPSRYTVARVDSRSPPRTRWNGSSTMSAVVDSLGEPVHLLDHSYGGLRALEAALRSRALRTLTLVALPDSRVVVLPGQGHAATDTATDVFTTEVHRFVKELR
jgi:pimeloyl-ACP methyl ester carboxylesterase